MHKFKILLKNIIINVHNLKNAIITLHILCIIIKNVIVNVQKHFGLSLSKMSKFPFVHNFEQFLNQSSKGCNSSGKW